MSVNIQIKIPKGKTYKPEQLIPGNMEFGIYDENYVLVEPQEPQDSIIAFDPNHIARGICIEVGEESVNLDLSSITGEEEIRGFYDLVRSICEEFKTTEFSKDDQPASLDQIDALIETEIQSCEAGLFIMTKKLEEGSDKVNIFGALNPIFLSLEDAKEIAADAKKFGEWLHKKQSITAHYAGPKLYEDPADKTIVGIYNFSAEIPTIAPYAPAPPFYFEEKVGRWLAYLYISDEEYGYINYNDFVTHTKKSGNYDAKHFIFEFSEDDIRALIKAFGVKL